mgnify:CR=1 FL=1
MPRLWVILAFLVFCASLGLAFTPEAEPYRLDTGDVLRVTVWGHEDLSAQVTVAPDGRAVAFASSRPGHLEVYRLPLTGGSPRRLTFLGRDSYAPRWSPRGDLIVFRSDRDGAPRLYLVRPDGTGLRRLSRRPRPLTVAEDAPAWSPDGRRLAYVERTPSGPRVWLVDLARGAERRLTPEDSAEDVPVWSPDGRVLALRAGRSTATDLVLVRPVEVGRTRLGVPGVRGPLVWVPAPRRCPTELDMVRGGP